MPTGYTHNIKDGISFQTYAMNCARAFGACITLRDEPGGGEKIPEVFEPSDYHQKAAQKARDELAVLLATTPEQRERSAAQAWDAAETSRLMMLEERRKTREAYEAMLKQVNAWTPPTSEHAEFHKFMRSQIEESIKFDCDHTYGNEPTKRLTGDEWAAEEAARLNRDIGYHERSHAEEVERARTRTAWVSALRSSLAAYPHEGRAEG